jgi:hypothetical protein
MFLTLLQSQGGPLPPPPPPPSGGGPGGTGTSTYTRRPNPAHVWELELQQAARVAAIAGEMSKSDNRQARRIARKIEDYTGEVRQLESLQREIARLEVAQREVAARTQLEAERDAALQALAYELSNILLDEEDAIQAILALDEFETRLMLAVVSIKLH